MIVDIAPLLTDPRVNLTHPAQLLALLDALQRPVFILFCASSTDTPPPDPASNWGGGGSNRLSVNVYDQVNREFAKGPTPRYLAVLEVGSKTQWKSSHHPFKRAYNLTACPTLLRLQLHTSSNLETTIRSYQFTAFKRDSIYSLRFFKKCDITHLPGSHDCYESSVNEYDIVGGGGWDGWRVRHDITSFMHNKGVKQAVAEQKWRDGWVAQLSENNIKKQRQRKMIEEGKRPKYEVPKSGLEGSVVESEGGTRRVMRVETVFSEDFIGETPVVGRVEEMESLEDYKKGGEREDEEEESVLEDGVERVDFAARIEMLESVVDPAETARLKWR